MLADATLCFYWRTSEELQGLQSANPWRDLNKVRKRGSQVTDVVPGVVGLLQDILHELEKLGSDSLW